MSSDIALPPFFGRASGLWCPVAVGTLAGTPAFSLMDTSRRKEPQLFPGVWEAGWPWSGSGQCPTQVQACGYGQGQALCGALSSWKAALLGWMQGI